MDRLRIVTMDASFAGMPDTAWLRRVLPNPRSPCAATTGTSRRKCAQAPGSPCCPARWATRSRPERVGWEKSPPGRDTWVGYHRDLRRLARLRALLDLIIDRLAN